MACNTCNYRSHFLNMKQRLRESQSTCSGMCGRCKMCHPQPPLRKDWLLAVESRSSRQRPRIIFSGFNSADESCLAGTVYTLRWAQLFQGNTRPFERKYSLLFSAGMAEVSLGVYCTFICPILLPLTSHRYWSLLNILRPKRHLNFSSRTPTCNNENKNDSYFQTHLHVKKLP